MPLIGSRISHSGPSRIDGGPDWCEDGYYKLCIGHNVYGINTMASIVSKAIIPTDDH